jgi:hypothetical protein
MKLTLTIPLVAALFATTGCTTLLTTNAFVAEEEALVDPHLAGIWTNDGDTLLIRLNGKAYEITYLDKGKDATKFAARLVRVGDAMLLDLSRDSDDPFVMSLHLAVRVWPEAGMLRWTLVDTDWLKEQALQLLTTQRDGDRTIVTAPGPAVREFMRRFAGDERARGKIETWTRAQ